MKIAELPSSQREKGNPDTQVALTMIRSYHFQDHSCLCCWGVVFETLGLILGRWVGERHCRDGPWAGL